MPTARFTAKWIAKVPAPATGQIDYFDVNSLGHGRQFGLRVGAGGRKSWFVMYRHNGKKRRLTLGNVNETGLAGARKKADAAVVAIIEQRDPAAEKQIAKKADTVAALAGQYIELYAKRFKKSWRRDLEILERDVLPLWGDWKAGDVRRRDVHALLDGIVARGAGVQANRTLAVLGKMFSWAAERDSIEHNPCYRVKAPTREQPRDRVLTDAEMHRVWHGLDTASMSAAAKLALRLMLVTAQRKGEVIGAPKAEFDLEARWWTIPGERTKNGRLHRVPLGRLAMHLTGEAWAAAPDSPWLFPSRSGTMRAASLNGAVRLNASHFGVDHWTPHDLRRTAATKMTETGTPRLVVGKILNHSEAGVTQIYDRNAYDLEKVQAMEAWERRLRAIISGEPVTADVLPIRR